MTTKTFSVPAHGIGWTVPIGVSSVTVDAYGGSGGGWATDTMGQPVDDNSANVDAAFATTGEGGSCKGGSHARGTVAVNAGTICYVHVGENGDNASKNVNTALGAYPGGGDGTVGSGHYPGGGGGGGYTDFRIGTNNVGGVAVLAAGGGGASLNDDGVNEMAERGGNATTAAGGAAGGGAWVTGNAGTSLNGADAKNPTPHTVSGYPNPVPPSGGGGGGGYYGGGSGGSGNADGGNGGNGSNFTKAGATGVVNTAPADTRIGVGTSLTARPVGSLVLTYSLPPNAPALALPFDGSNVDATATVPFSWTDSTPPETGDAVTGAQIQYRAVGDADWTQLATIANAGGSYVAAAGTFAVGADIEWQVRSKGTLTANYGPWSVSYYFTPIAPPDPPTITAPTAGQSITTSPLVVNWNAVTGQQAWEVRRVGDTAGAPNPATVYYDSGVNDNGLSGATIPFDAATRTEHVEARVLVNGLWSNWADVSVAVAITPPTSPTIVAAPSSTTASITLTITNPSGGVAVDHNDIYRSSPAEAEIRVATGLPANASWTDTTPANGIVYTYRGVAVAANGAASL